MANIYNHDEDAAYKVSTPLLSRGAQLFWMSIVAILISMWAVEKFDMVNALTPVRVAFLVWLAFFSIVTGVGGLILFAGWVSEHFD